MTTWAARVSSQKPGCWDCSVSWVISVSSLDRSKTHPDFVDAGAYGADGLVEVFG
jgi:hypothetical protein